MIRLPLDEEYNLFLAKCAKKKIIPTPELFKNFQKMVEKRLAVITSEAYKAFEKERLRRQQRTVEQTINEDGAIISPVDDVAYTTKRAWNDHIKANQLIERGNELTCIKDEKKEKQEKFALYQ